MEYHIAAIDVHKKMLAVVVADVAGEGAYQFQRRKFGTTPDALRLLARWLNEQKVEEVVMESTAQYWKPVWGSLEQYWSPLRRQRAEAGQKAGTLHLCQAKSNRGPRGRKNDFGDGERLLKRYVAQELVLSYVPDPEQRLWRTVTRRKLQLTRDRVRLKSQLESLLEQAHLKLSSLVSDLLGVSARRMLQALADGEKDPGVLAAMRDRNLKATAEQLRDGLGACVELHPMYRRLLKGMLEELGLLDRQIAGLERAAMELMQAHGEVIRRVAEVPGFGVDSALQMIAEVGPRAAAFGSAKQLCSWVGVCPGEEESAGKSQSERSPKGNRYMRRLLNQAAHAAVKVKGSIFAMSFQRMLPRMGYKKAIWATAHRLCRVLWILLHKGVSYQERGPAVSAKSKRTRTARMIRDLRKLGYRVEGGPVATTIPA